MSFLDVTKTKIFLVFTVFFVFKADNTLSQIKHQFLKEVGRISTEEIVFDNKDTLSFELIQVPLQEKSWYSSKKSRDILVLKCNQKVVQQFDDIDGYFTLFFNESSFEFVKLNKDDKKDLVIFIDAFEAIPMIWLFLNKGEHFRFIEALQATFYNFNFSNRQLEVVRYPLHDNWIALNDFGIYSGIRAPLWHDFYEISSDTLVNINSHKESVFDAMLNEYEQTLSKLKTAYKSKSEEWEIDVIKEEMEGFKKLILDCKDILSSKSK